MTSKKSKRIICGIVAATMVLGATFSGCTLISTNNEEDLKQVIATVDITKSANLKDEGLEDVATTLSSYYDFSTDILKRDLVSAFFNIGYSYVSNGSTYSAVFTALVDGLISTAIISQYATLYTLNDMVKTDSSAIAQFVQTDWTDVDRYEYLLGGSDSKYVNIAKYNLYVSINSSLDSIEETNISDSDSTAGTATRTTPTNVDTEKDDYYPQDSDGNLNYGIYTGYEGYLLKDSWDYEAVEGTTRNTRRTAYNSFITSLKSNYLLTDEDTNVTDVLNLSYVKEEYVSQLQQQVIARYLENYENDQEAKILETNDDGEYIFLKRKYESYLAEQAISYSDTSAFETAMGSMSDTSFILYSPDTTTTTVDETGDGLGNGAFGYVYNILLPFSTTQSNRLTEYSSYLSDTVVGNDEYYIARRKLLSEITTTDQRSAWFNGETDYSFDASSSSLNYYKGANGDRNYLFFENNLTKTEKYEELEKYLGLYTYNGKVTKNTDGTYALTPNKLTIDDMLKEFVAYVNFVLGDEGSAQQPTYNDNYNATTYYKADGKTIDYSKFVYATGLVTFGGTNKNSMLVTSSAQYKAMAAVNELQYAYTTDTSVLSQYIGYSVSAYTTSYIKEFEYAAQTAIKEAVKNSSGAYTVCAGDYGWHLIYVTDTYAPAGGEVYNVSWTAEQVNTEGTFENKFYQWMKDSILTDVSTNRRSIIVELFGGDTTTTKYEDTYKDLLELDDD
jgi:hypothetical protein